MKLGFLNYPLYKHVFFDAHTIYASSDFLTYHMPSLFIEREETTNKTGSSMTTRLMMKHPNNIVS